MNSSNYSSSREERHEGPPRKEGIFMKYHKAITLARNAHEAFSRIHPLAQAIEEEAATQREQAGEALISIADSSFAVQELERLGAFDSRIWHLQLALMWDYLPICREAILARCKDTLARVMGQLQEWLQHPSTKCSRLKSRTTGCRRNEHPHTPCRIIP
jgi:hypothetical protein